MSTPRKATRPDCGGVSPMIERIVVDLPTPLRPSRHTHSPVLTSIETPKSTRDRPYAGWRSRTSSSGAREAALARDAVDQADRLPRLAGRHAGRGLVEQQDVGLEGQGQAQLELLLRAVRQEAGGLAGAVGEPQRVQQAQRLVAVEVPDGCEEVPAAPTMRQEGGLDVLEDGQLGRAAGRERG